MLSTAEPAHDVPTSLAPRVWRDKRWVGSIAGRTTTPDLLAGASLSADHARTITRIYAAACADLAEAMLGGLSPRSAEWDCWFGGLRSTARELSPAHGNPHIVQRALFHGVRLEGTDALWAHQLRRGFSALLAAGLPEPVSALIGEDLDTFRAADTRWLEHESESLYGGCAGSESLAAPAVICEIPLEATRWPLSNLRPNPLNPRGKLDPTSIEELTASIAAHAAQGGILQPLLVTPDGTVVAGHRRLAAARRAGLIDVPIVVRALSPVEALELALVENLQRADLTPVEEARAYQHLVAAGATLASIARRVGVPASRVRERLALLDLDERVRERVHRGDLPLRVALLLLPLRDHGRQWRLASTAIRRRLTIAQVRALVETALALPPPPPSCSSLPADDEPEGAGLSVCRQTALEALRAESDRHISFGDLVALAVKECCACGLASAPTVCADCPNLHLLQAVARHGTGCG
jgi:ParB family transcriptional regulator, chromosome partitioning protein